MTTVASMPASARAVVLLALTGVAAYAGHLGLGLLPGLERAFADYVYSGVLAASAGLCLARAATRRDERAAWALLGLGLLAWTAGEIYFSVFLVDENPTPFPSPSDALMLLFYPASYAALVLLMLPRLRGIDASAWLDGLVAALAVGALTAALALGPVLDATGRDTAAIATALAYPVADVVLLGLAAGVFGLTRGRPGPPWGLLGAGLAAVATADVAFVDLSARGLYDGKSLLDAAWPFATLMLGAAAWTEGRSVGKLDIGGRRALVLPAGFVLVAVTLLAVNRFTPLNELAFGLAAATLATVALRLLVSSLENVRLVAALTESTLTDPLTALANRRRLVADLDEAAERAMAGAPHYLLLFDLDGFKAFNDAHGHPAGDVLLARLAGRLRLAAGAACHAYRLGGDEFCLLGEGEAAQAAAAGELARAALSEHGAGYEVGCSSGAVLLPGEASTPSAALHLADRRLYADKDVTHRTAATDQAHRVLIQALNERQPELARHAARVADLAQATGRLLGIAGAELRDLRRAAELDDIGKLAMCASVLDNPAALNEAEIALVRQHHAIGERILAAAPSLGAIRRIVHSAHERWDGAGYPDGLAGEEIPLASRIVFVCDAFEAMTSDRAHRTAMALDEAVAELRRAAGAQFDPAVVAAFCESLILAEKRAGRTDGGQPD